MSTWVWPNGSATPPNLKPGGGTIADAPNSEPNADGLVVSSEFNDADHNGRHNGIDLVGYDGRTRSIGDGTVIFAGWNSGGYGNVVQVQHDDGSLSMHAHLSEIHVSVGQRVGAGEVVGVWGSTGNSTGTHEHLATSDGVSSEYPWINPRDFIAARQAGGGGGGGGGIPDADGWVVGTTLYQGAIGDIPLDAGAVVYAAGPGDGEIFIAESHGLSWEQLKAQTEKLGASKWASQILAPQQSIHIFGQTVYQGQIFAINDVAAILDANEAAIVAAQQAERDAAIAESSALAESKSVQPQFEERVEVVVPEAKPEPTPEVVAPVKPQVSVEDVANTVKDIDAKLSENAETIGAAGDVIVDQVVKILPAEVRAKVYQTAQTGSAWVAGIGAVTTASATVLAIFEPQIGAIVGAAGGAVTTIALLLNRWVAKLAGNNVTPGT